MKSERIEYLETLTSWLVLVTWSWLALQFCTSGYLGVKQFLLKLEIRSFRSNFLFWHKIWTALNIVYNIRMSNRDIWDIDGNVENNINNRIWDINVSLSARCIRNLSEMHARIHAKIHRPIPRYGGFLHTPPIVITHRVERINKMACYNSCWIHTQCRGWNSTLAGSTMIEN